LPERYLAKLFTRLKSAGLIVGREGIQGGYTLARSPDKISVRDILDAVSPDSVLFECAEIRRHCALYHDEPPPWSVKGMCRIHLFMKETEDNLRKLLAAKSLADLGNEFEKKAPSQFIRDAETWFLNRREKRATGPRQIKAKKKLP
jgi:Rrf2 family protein